jgi:hypothetical protein
MQQLGVRDILASLYQHLEIDAEKVTLQDQIGRPIPILPEGRPIPELTGRGR